MVSSSGLGASHRATRSLLGRGSVYALGQALQLTSAVLVIPVITRLLSPSGYGGAASALAVTRVVAVIAALGLPSAITLEHFKSQRGPNGARLLVVAVAIVALGSCVPAALTTDLWSAGLAIGTDWTLKLALLNAGLLAVVLAEQAVLQAKNQVGQFVSLTGISTLGGQAIGLTLVVAVDATATAYLAGLFAGYLTAAVCGAVMVFRRERTTWDRSVFRPALAVGLPTVPHSVALYVLALGDRILIGRLLGLTDVGRYDLAYQVGALVLVLLIAYNQAWAPLVYGASDADRWTLLVHTSDFVTKMAGLGAIAVAAAAPLLLKLAAPADYNLESLSTVTCLTALAVLPFSTYLARVHVVFQQRSTRVLAWCSPLAAVIGISTCALLVPVMGLAGAALATLAGYLIQATALHLASGSLVDIPWNLKTTATVWLGATGAVLGTELLPGSWLGSVIRSALFACVAITAFVVARKAVGPRTAVSEFSRQYGSGGSGTQDGA